MSKNLLIALAGDRAPGQEKQISNLRQMIDLVPTYSEYLFNEANDWILDKPKKNYNRCQSCKKSLKNDAPRTWV